MVDRPSVNRPETNQWVQRARSGDSNGSVPYRHKERKTLGAKLKAALKALFKRRKVDDADLEHIEQQHWTES